ncbi:hypothetical protein BC828DRAFT_378987 [Blastocladiella britannica]|nr:hypothetical protein BC828DRAFT_378987 [Blastocladiella britannica]
MAAQYDIVFAIHDFNAEDEDEVTFKTGEEIIVLERDAEFGDGWWMGRTRDGQIGLFPANFTSPTPVSPTATETSTSYSASMMRDGTGTLTSSHASNSVPASPTSFESPDAPRGPGGPTAGAVSAPSTKHPNHRASVQSFASDTIDQVDAFLDDMRKSIHLSQGRLAEARRKSASGPSGVAAATNGSLGRPPLPAVPADSALGHSSPASLSRSPLMSSGPGSPPGGSLSRSLTPPNNNGSSGSLPRGALPSAPQGGPHRGRSPMAWSPRDVADWLASVGFANFADNFVRNEINGEAMLSLTLPTLKELDIPALGKRIQIMNSIHALREEYALADDASAASARGRSSRGPGSSLSSNNGGGVRGRSAHLSPAPPSLANRGVPDMTMRERSRSPYSTHSHAHSTLSSNSGAGGGYPSPPAPMHSHLDPRYAAYPPAAEGGSGPAPNRGLSPSPAPLMYGGGVGGGAPMRMASPVPTRTITPTPRDMLDVTPADLQPADNEGLLKTLENVSGYGGKDAEFKRRWMVLKGNALYWFKEAKEGKAAANAPPQLALHCVYVHSGFKVSLDDGIKSSRHGFRLTELNPEAGPRKHWLFYSTDAAACRLWVRSLTKATIYHSQHEASKRGTRGVEIIGDPREVIQSIRVNDEALVGSELAAIARDWMERDPLQRQTTSSSTSSAPRPGRRPSLPGHHTEHAGEFVYPPPMPGSTIPRSKSTEPFDHPRLPPAPLSNGAAGYGSASAAASAGGAGATPPGHARTPSTSSGTGSMGRRGGAWDDGREKEITRMRQQAHYLLYVNSALPPNESVSALRDLVSGLAFIHFLSNVTRTALPPHFVRAVRDPAVYRIDWLDNWDVVLSWAGELGIVVPQGVTVEQLASGREEAMLDLIESVQGSYAPRPIAK